MKKAIVIALILCFALSCTACGGQTTKDPADNTITDSSGKEGNVTWEGPCLLQIKLNSEFAFALDGSNTVVEMYLLNADAVAVFANENVSGQPLDEVLRRCIDLLYENGYFADGTPQFTFTVKAENSFDTTSVVNCIDTTAAAFMNATGITLSVSTDTQAVAEADRQLQVYTVATGSGNKNEATAGGERPAVPAGPTEVESDDEWLNDPHITVEKDTDGNIVKYIRTADRCVEEFNADKVLVKSTTYRSDGTVEDELFFDTAGNIIRKIHQYPSAGEIWETTYSGGISISDVVTGPDGITTITYHANGNCAKREQVLTNGNIDIEIYNTAGIITHLRTVRNGGDDIKEIVYDSNGKPSTGTITIISESIVSPLVYQPDGSYEQWFTSPEGYEVYNKFAADGSVIVCLIGDDAPPRP